MARTMVASILKIVITRNTICDNLVGFPKSGHKYRMICLLSEAVEDKPVISQGLVGCCINTCN